MYTICLPDARNSQKKVLDPPGVELETVRSHYINIQNPIWVLLQEKQMLLKAESILQPSILFLRYGLSLNLELTALGRLACQ